MTDRTEALADLLTKAIGDIAAALTMGGNDRLIAKWTAPYVEAVNRVDASHTAPVGDVEAVARALANSHGLDFDEVCGVDADPDNGYCDSGTCIASGYEDHDAGYARSCYLADARAAIAAMGGRPDKLREASVLLFESLFHLRLDDGAEGYHKKVEAFRQALGDDQ